MDEIQQLKMNIAQADFSIKNPRVKNFILAELRNWLKSYNNKKTIPMMDNYGNPGDIPTKVRLNGKAYPPYHLVRNVEYDTKVGKVILERIYSAWSPKIQENIQRLLDGVTENDNLEIIAQSCRGGEHSLTLRETLKRVSNFEINAPILGIGLPDAIMSLYQN